MQCNGTNKLPPFGKALANRQQFKNLPFLAVVCVGADAWANAKHWNSLPNDCIAMVLPHDIPTASVTWPVSHCTCLIEWNTGPSSSLIIELVKCLLIAGAEQVTVRPLFVDINMPAVEYDPSLPADNRWRQVREMIRTYYPPRKEAAVAA